MESCTVRTASGRVEGTVGDGVTVFRGIPFARPPVGDLRFDAPRRAPEWDGTRPEHERVVAPLQEPSRLADVLGPMDVPGCDEDCLTLDVWTPSADPAATLPVLVWLHGGAYLSGAGSAAWYDGSSLARRGGIVVVTVNYRLGALGYLALPASMCGQGPGANRGLLDQRLALEWVQENIARFGGDAGRVTVGGQSAGAHSVLALSKDSVAGGLFRRAILQSAPFGLPAATPEAAERVTEVFLDAAGIAVGDRDGLLSLSAAQVLDAQRRTVARTAVPGSVMPTLQLVVDGTVLDEDPVAAALAGSMDDGDLLVGTTADEMAAFVGLFAEDFWRWDRARISADLRDGPRPTMADRFETYLARGLVGSPASALLAVLRDDAFVDGMAALVERRASVGNPAYAFCFTLGSPAAAGKPGACHCIDLPLVFNNLECWVDAPMLAGLDREEVTALATRTQDAWVSFVEHGDPGKGSGVDWSPYARPDRVVMEFGAHVGAVNDPASRRSLLV